MDKHEDAKILAGGQSLLPMMKFRLASPGLLIDINRINGLDYLREEDGWLKIGALTREAELDRSDLVHRRYPLLADTCRLIADPTVRNLATFDRAFAAFWESAGKARSGLVTRTQGRIRPVQRLEIVAPPLTALQQAFLPKDEKEIDPQDPPLVEATLTYSANEILRRKDFAGLDAAETETVRRFLTAFCWELGERNSRRFQYGGRDRLDLRHVLRHNFRYGGELLEWHYKNIRSLPRSLVVLADISGSMERYSRLLLYFLHSLNASLEQNVEAFVFSTRLTRITNAGLIESHPHDVTITREAPNYQRGE